jgi:hypothetical protein
MKIIGIIRIFRMLYCSWNVDMSNTTNIYFLINSTLMSKSTSLPTNNPPAANVPFQVSPNCVLSIIPVTLNPALVFLKGSITVPLYANSSEVSFVTP